MKKLRLPLTMLAALLLMTALSAGLLVAPASAAETHNGVDFSRASNIQPQVFKDTGVEFVVRYLAGNTAAWKEITPAEVGMWSQAGINVVLVWETKASRATEGYAAGYQDASIAFPQAEAVGMPYGRPIYFAVDIDTSGPSVDDYFRGVYDWARTHFADGMATSRIGVYGGYEPVKHIMGAGYAKYGWQSLAWMKGRGWLPNVMQQYEFKYTLGGIACDKNRVALDDYGQWTSTRVAPTKVAIGEALTYHPEAGSAAREMTGPQPPIGGGGEAEPPAQPGPGIDVEPQATSVPSEERLPEGPALEDRGIHPRIPFIAAIDIQQFVPAIAAGPPLSLLVSDAS